MSITITHLEGPLAGGVPQHFDETVPDITFGRDPESCQVVYPPEYTIVGKKHFQLKRVPSGDYCVQLFGDRYVEIDGEPADPDAPVTGESVFRIGNNNGPTFKCEIETVKSTLPDTEPPPPRKGWRQVVAETRSLMLYGFGALAFGIVGVVILIWFTETSFEDQIKKAKVEERAEAQQEFSQATIKRLEQSVYLVAKREGGSVTPEATAWAFAPTKLATNAHVTEAIKNDREGTFFLIAPDGRQIEIIWAMSHPGYAEFKSIKATKGAIIETPLKPLFQSLDLTSAYDVGIIEVSPAKPLSGTLDLASTDELQHLQLGMPVASAGFPSEKLVGWMGLVTDPEITLGFGHISSLKDVFMRRGDGAKHQLLVQHSVPVTGGSSGSPLIDRDGKVIAIVSGGNVIPTGDSTTIDKSRAPSAALVNFAQRIDLLTQLDAGHASDDLKLEEAYWDEAGKRFNQYFEYAQKAFFNDAIRRYGVSAGEEHLLGTDALTPPKGSQTRVWVGRTYDFPASPGYIYGFIADPKSGIPIGINVRQDGKIIKQMSYELDLAPTAWATVSEPKVLQIEVWGTIDQPAKYTLYAYAWPEHKGSPAPTGSIAAESKQ